MSNKVCILTTGHPALDDRIFYKEAQSLHNAGFQVTLIAPLNSDGYLTDMGRKPIARGETVVDGIRIIGFELGRYKIFGLPMTGLLNQWMRLGSVGRLRLGSELYSDIIDKGIQLDADIYHCHEVWSLYTGILIKRELEKRGKNPKLISDVHEYWSAARPSDTEPERTVWSRIIARFEKNSLEEVDYVITANHITRGHLLSANRFIKTEVLDNCPVLSIFQESEPRAVDGVITICHDGALPFNRGLKEMLEVIKILKERYEGKIRFLVVGDVFGEERTYFDQKVKEYRIEDVVNRTGWLPYEKVGDALSDCSIGIIFMELTENNMLAGPPNKLFNYMRYGLPTVTVDLPETRRIVLESQCGIVVKDRNVDSLVDVLSRLVDDADLRTELGKNAQAAAYKQYNWSIMEKRLLRVYNELLSETQYVLQVD
ncbi:glycosyltransferase family 4 protein [Candidatus Poribacteria bacterium]|nr:glycosyltransferase family 4 protein [Candidatus Poribacteria bacterium]